MLNWLNNIPDERRDAVKNIIELLDKHLPNGFEKAVNGNFLNYQVPLSIYPKGYHCTANTPLPFISLCNQKGAFSIYHMGIYADPELLQWFQTEYNANTKYKMDMGKSCLRLKRMDDISFDVLSQLFEKMTPETWISLYESKFRK